MGKCSKFIFSKNSCHSTVILHWNSHISLCLCFQLAKCLEVGETYTNHSPAVYLCFNMKSICQHTRFLHKSFSIFSPTTWEQEWYQFLCLPGDIKIERLKRWNVTFLQAASLWQFRLSHTVAVSGYGVLIYIHLDVIINTNYWSTEVE